MPDFDIKVDGAFVEKLRRLFQLEESDLADIRQLPEWMLQCVQQAADETLDYLLSFPDIAALLRSDESRQKMRLGQKAVFVDLVTSRVDEVYVRRCLQIGVVHEGAGLEPPGYLACYSFFTRRLRELMIVAAAAQGFSQEELTKTYHLILTLIYLNIALVWQAYYKVREQKVRDSYKALEVSHNLSLRMIDERDKEIKELLAFRQSGPSS